MFCTGKDIVSIFDRTKNQMRRLCVGGDMLILYFSDPAVFATIGYFQKNLCSPKKINSVLFVISERVCCLHHLVKFVSPFSRKDFVGVKQVNGLHIS